MKRIPLCLSLVGALWAGSTAIAADGDDSDAPRVKVVELRISSNAAEDPAPANPLGGTRRNFRSKLALLRRIASDPAVAGVKLEVSGAPDFARALDLLEQLNELKTAGKKIVCYTEQLTQGQLHMASCADLLVVPPSGMIILEGLAAEVMYMKDLLAKLDVRVELLTMGDHKTAYEQLGRSDMSAAQRVMLEQMLDEYYGQMIATIARNRGIAPAAVEALFGQLIVDPQLAAEGGLIDAAVYHDGFEQRVETLFGGEVEYVDDYGDDEMQDIEALMSNPFALMANLESILNPPPPKAPAEPHVAIVYCSGAIISGKSQVDMQGNVASMGSDTIVAALEKVRKDDNCKAVVLRVNSPGGSALASDMIWRAIERVREKKPVISSMGYVAASGGYWISMGCDAIMAQPSTITGSIGVVSMLPDVSSMVKDLGINVEVVARGPMGDKLSLLRNGPSEELKQIMRGWMENVYDEFIHKVATGRRMQPDAVRAIAGGRVWTGRKAEELGLVDVLGGLDDAIALACTMGGSLDPEQTPVAEYPHPANFFEQLEESMNEMAMAPDMALGDLALDAMLRRFGVEAYRPLVDDVLSSPAHMNASRVQCILPWSIRLR